MLHAQSLQVQFPDGTSTGKMKQHVPPITNTNISLKHLVRYIHYSKEQMNKIDLANYRFASKSFTCTALSRAHAYKNFNNQWYTDAQAHIFNSDLSPTCRCCQFGKNETIAHIIGCPSCAQTHGEYRLQVTAHFQACRISIYLLKALELWMGVVLSDTESHQGDSWRGNTEGSEIERKVATFFVGDTVSAQVKDAFFSQLLLGWEVAFQGRYSIRWESISAP